MVRSFVVMLLVAGSATAQGPPVDPAPVRPTVSPTAILVDLLPPGPPAAAVVIDPGPVCQTRGSFDILAGVFTGLRYQAMVGAGGPWSAEVYGGFTAVVLPTVGVGIRRRAFATNDPSDLLTVSPGIVAYTLFTPWDLNHDNGTVGGAVVLDVDFTWKHLFSRNFEGNLGVKVGAGVVFGRGGVVPYPIPVCSVFFGCGF
jgi:hypothetical protein